MSIISLTVNGRRHTLDVDPTGRYLYYVLGAHGGSQHDGTPIVQFDVNTKRKKIIAFLHPFYQDKNGYTPLGTFSSAIDPRSSPFPRTGSWRRSAAGTSRRTIPRIPAVSWSSPTRP